MLRALDPDNDYQPKSKSLVPTAEERKKFSRNELDHIEQQIADDEEWRVARAVRETERRALLKIADAVGGGEGAPATGLRRRQAQASE